MRAGVWFLLVILLAACQDDRAPTPTPTPPSTSAPLDLNAATLKQLEALPGIGPKHAHSILASRNARGGRFRSLDELLEIDGIGQRTIDTIRPYVVVTP